MKFARNIVKLQQAPGRRSVASQTQVGLVVLSYPEVSQGPLGEREGAQAVDSVSSVGHLQDVTLP